jgi:A/G-specific adenine glycosylase
MLGGMSALPGPEWSDNLMPLIGSPVAKLRHVFTHFALDLTIVAGGEVEDDGWWQPIDRIADAGLPTLYRRAVDLILAKRGAGLAA